MIQYILKWLYYLFDPCNTILACLLVLACFPRKPAVVDFETIRVLMPEIKYFILINQELAYFCCKY